MFRLVLAEDHQIVRKGLRALLSSEADFNVVAETGDGLEAIEIVQQHKPDVLILDLSMPGLDGLEVLRRVTSTNPGTKTVVLSMHNNESYIARSLQYGAMAYVLKDSSVDDLVKAVRSSLIGKRFLSPVLGASLSNDWEISRPNSIEDRYELLTLREREILQLVAEGLTSTEIAERLFISPRTADTHRTNLMIKLDLKNQTDLVHFAIQRGFIQPKPRRRES